MASPKRTVTLRLTEDEARYLYRALWAYRAVAHRHGEDDGFTALVACKAEDAVERTFRGLTANGAGT